MRGLWGWVWTRSSGANLAPALVSDPHASSLHPLWGGTLINIFLFSFQKHIWEDYFAKEMFLKESRGPLFQPRAVGAAVRAGTSSRA